MRYQAVARDLAGNPLKNQHIGLRIGIRAGAANGELAYQETHHISTDGGGQFAITVGGGRVETGDFSAIPWGSAEMWLTVALDEKGKDNFKPLTASQLWTVPYAFHAGTAENFQFMETGTAAKRCGATGIPFWANLGNTNVSDTCHFIGTVNAVDFIIKTNNTEWMRITKDGKVLVHGILDVLDLHVRNNAEIDNNLTVHNSAEIDNDLAVHNNADIGNNLNVDKQLTVGSRLVINGAVSGSDANINNYPVLVQGSNQGIAVKVTGSRNNSNNFISFWDEAGGMQGRIEGQTADEVINSFDYIWESTMMGLQVGFLGAEAGCAGSQLDLCEAALLAAQAITLGAEWGKNTTQMINDAGVAYESGNGDYAEWLEKSSPTETFRTGEVVGVRGGRISRCTDQADHFMVVSTSPIVLGNMPPPDRQHNFEKIAFMGQVPVRVMGSVAVGDYLLASGHNDGFAVAVNPVRMRTEDYARIVGVAWEASGSPLGGMVNTAVGINANDIAYRVAQQQRELAVLKQQINQLYLHAGLPAPNAAQEAPAVVAGSAEKVNAGDKTLPEYSKEEINRWLEENRPVFEASMNREKNRLEQQGANIRKYPEIAAIYADPVQFLKQQNEKGYLWDMLSAVGKK